MDPFLRPHRPFLRPLFGISVALLTLSTIGCAGIRGDRVETGTDDRPVLVAPEATLAPTSTDGFSDAVTPAAARGSAPRTSPLATAEPEAFGFVAPELFTGAPVSGVDIYESGPALMVFVSPGCVISVEESPDLAASAEMNPTVTYVFVHTGGDPLAYQQFVEGADLYQQNSIHIDDTERVLWNRFGVTTQPSTVLVDGDGLVSITAGGLGTEGLDNAIGLVAGP